MCLRGFVFYNFKICLLLRNYGGKSKIADSRHIGKRKFENAYTNTNNFGLVGVFVTMWQTVWITIFCWLYTNLFGLFERFSPANSRGSKTSKFICVTSSRMLYLRFFSTLVPSSSIPMGLNSEWTIIRWNYALFIMCMKW